MKGLRPGATTTSLLLGGTCVSLLLGCSAHQPGSTRASGPLPGDAHGDAAARAAEARDARSRDEVREALARLDASFDDGLALWMEGDADRALTTFDEGLLEALDEAASLRHGDALRSRAVEIMEQVHVLVMTDGESEGSEELELPAADAVQDEDAASARRVAEVSEPTDGQRSGDANVPEWLAPATGEYTLPWRDHPAVEAMIRFYTGRGKERLELGLSRVGLYGPTLSKILEEEGVPPDVLWLAMVESNFNPQAYSRARAKGLWQFIPATGRRYGLGLDFWVDERADFEKATRSSAAYLKDLHELFGDWHLALAAYNAGEGRVGRAVRRTGQRDYWEIRNTRHIRRETKSYVPALLAVMAIVRDPEAYGVRFELAEPLGWETARLEGSSDLSVLAECAGTTKETLECLNPELRRGVTPSDYTLRIPAGTRATFESRYAALPPEKRLRWHRHVVRRGDNLTLIARAYGSSVSALMAANELKSPHRIGVGWELMVPTGDTAKLPASRVARAAGSTSSSGATTSSYRVRPGDTLTRIARLHGTSVGALAQLNGLSNADRIRPGQRLMVRSQRRVSTTSYRVRPGDTISEIARAHSTSVSAISSANGLRNAHRIRPGQSLRIPAGRSSVHVVRRGDTLIEIARRHGTTVSDLRAWNDLSPRRHIQPGQRLRVSGPARKKVHDVRSGDTLYDIARAYRTTVDELRRWNNLSRNRYIRPGDRLTILAD